MMRGKFWTKVGDAVLRKIRGERLLCVDAIALSLTVKRRNASPSPWSIPFTARHNREQLQKVRRIIQPPQLDWSAIVILKPTHNHPMDQIPRCSRIFQAVVTLVASGLDVCVEIFP
jgi:hypothetical protein